MRWEEYQETYYSFKLSVNQTVLANALAGAVMEGFPARLPATLRSPIMRSLGQLFRAVQDLLSPSDFPGIGEKLAELDFSGFEGRPETSGASQQSPFAQIGFEPGYKVFELLLATTLLGSSVTDLDFRHLTSSQALVMVLAHLDAFIADSLRATCHAQPEVIKSQRKVTWETVMSCGDWDTLFTHLVEKYVFKSTWGTVVDRVHAMQKELKLLENVPELDLALLKKAEQTRNVIVHNGGRVSQEFVDRTGLEGAEIGDLVPVPFEYVDEIAVTSSSLAGWLFGEVSIKFFGMKASQIGTIFDMDQESLWILDQMDS